MVGVVGARLMGRPWKRSPWVPEMDVLSLDGVAESPDQFISEWGDPTYSTRAGQKVVVMAVAESEINGRIWESAMGKELEARGFRAIPGSTLLGTTNARPDSVAVARQISLRETDRPPA